MEKEATGSLGPPPRKARFRRAIRNMRRAYRTMFGLMILVFAGWAVLDGARLYKLSYRTQTATGKITNKESVSRSGPQGAAGARDFRLSYAFLADDGTGIQDVATVTAEAYEAAKEGDACTVVYLPENPSGEHWFHDNLAARTSPQFMMICLGLAAMMALVVLVWIDRPLRRELVLARRGVVAQGQIVATGKGRRRRARPWIRYTFTTAQNVAMQGRCVVPRSTSADARAVGTPIEVLYHPRRPRINKARLGLDFVEFA